ncbi:NACHT domain-containing protein [Spirillospora sp. CA-294931]|uniref:NACHT domain-containing protein n=1 Tax=Spirillospora sp. CA-294931 TaxID=3240042 RepID=UPI003D8FC97D
MRRLRFAGRTLVGASLTVATGVAVNQILNDGKLSWSYGYLALVFTVLGALVQAAPPAGAQAEQAPRRRRGSRREYLRRVRSSVNQMETIGLVTQAEFVLRAEQVYVDVMLQPKPVTDAMVDSGIGPAPRPPDATVGRRASLASFLTEKCVLAVLGAAGSGKTTLARHTALELTRRRWGRRRVPVLLYLRDHAEAIKADRPKGLPEIAVTAHWLDGAIPAEWLERRLTRGRCVVLLDGLDEVADAQDRSRVVRWVEAQISRYPGNAFVITSRPQGYDTNRLTRADILQVQRFTNHQIHAFLRAWYRAIEHRARKADPQEIDRIAVRAADDLFRRITGRPTLYELGANPLLLTMIANVHRYRGNLPGSRAALYEEVCQVLLHRRQEAKNLPDAGLDGLDGDKKERVIQELALYMMRHRMRDISIEDAQRAIRPVLERTVPTLTPEVFLTHARRSGLLLERQYERYGFAHLTLQEYLAAALIPGHASRRQLLVDNVDQTWWRETTLLWAARADASPVVEACLAARTVTALNLAYACAAEARELDPDLRAQLDHLLTTTPTDPDEIRLLDGIAAARALQDTHALDDECTRICAHPVSPELWNRYTAHASLPPAPTANLWSADIEGFLAWLDNLFTDGASYRLPTPAEARHALGSDLYPAATTTLYADDEAELRLISSAPARHPHRPTEQQISLYPDLILHHTHLLFRLLFPRSALTFSQLIAYARPRDLDRPEDQLVQTLDLALHLLFVLDLPLPLPRALDLGIDLIRARELVIDRARVRALNLNLDIGRELAPLLHLNQEILRNLDRQHLALDGDRELNRAVSLHLNRALTRAEDLARDLNLNLDSGSHADLGPYLGRFLAAALDHGGHGTIQFDHGSELTPHAGITADLDRALNRAPTSTTPWIFASPMTSTVTRPSFAFTLTPTPMAATSTSKSISPSPAPPPEAICRPCPQRCWRAWVEPVSIWLSGPWPPRAWTTRHIAAAGERQKERPSHGCSAWS